MANDRKVIFRRVRGRIVPIHVKEAAKDVGLGGLAAVGTGVVAGKLFDAPGAVRRLAKNAMLKEVAKQKRTAFKVVDAIPGQMTFGDDLMGAAKKLRGNPIKTFKKFRRLDNVARIAPKLAVPLFIGGAALSGALVARGIAKARKEKNPTLNTAVAQNIGDAGAFGLAGLALLRTRGVKFGSALKEVIEVTPSWLKKIKR